MNVPSPAHAAAAHIIADGCEAALIICLRLSPEAVAFLETTESRGKIIHDAWTGVFCCDDRLMSEHLERCADPQSPLTWNQLSNALYDLDRLERLEGLNDELRARNGIDS